MQFLPFYVQTLLLREHITQVLLPPAPLLRLLTRAILALTPRMRRSPAGRSPAAPRFMAIGCNSPRGNIVIIGNIILIVTIVVITLMRQGGA